MTAQEISEAQVIEATIEQLSKPHGYTPDAYEVGRGGRFIDGPGPKVVATCAIGGVEQAIWKLTGKQVATADDDDARSLFGREKNHFLTESKIKTLKRSRTLHMKLYKNTMARLNRLSRTLYPQEEVLNFEDITMVGTRQTQKRRLMNVLNTALGELGGEK